MNLAVAPEHRGKGLASTLLAAVLQEAKARGAEVATLEVRVSNIPARKLYERFGFRIVGMRRHYYRDNGEHALILELNPIPSQV